MENDPELLESLIDSEYKATPERIFNFRISIWDINCPQHLKRRFTVDEFQAIKM